MQVAVILPIDETSIINTEVSDPIWDGYTSSPYYNNTVTSEEISIKENIKQPVLPWDELFFELEPIDDISIKTNSQTHKKTRINTPSNQSNVISTQASVKYHRNHHSYHSKPSSTLNCNCNQLNETILISSNSSVPSSPTSTNSKDSTNATLDKKKLNSLVKFSKKLYKKLKQPAHLLEEFDSIMDELNRILNDSLHQFKQASSQAKYIDANSESNANLSFVS
jgi:hypothetical protein